MSDAPRASRTTRTGGAHAHGNHSRRRTDRHHPGLGCGGGLATPGAVIGQGVVDPFEPPLPPKITTRQALHFAESLACGEPNGDRIALTVLSDRVRELI
jgi:hypothetical protein